MARHGTRHGTGKGKWRRESKTYKSKRTGKTVTYYWYRERITRKKGGKRKIRYKPGGIRAGGRKASRKNRK